MKIAIFHLAFVYSGGPEELLSASSPHTRNISSEAESAGLGGGLYDYA